MQKSPKPIKNMDKRYIFFSILLAIGVISTCTTLRQGPLIELYDYWEHAACVREMASNLSNPGNPLLNTTHPDTLRYTPYVLIMALTKRIFNLGLFNTITLFSFLNLGIFLSGIYLWSREYFQDEEMPIYVLVAMMCLWAKPFDYSNEYSMRFLCYTLFYPSIFSFSLGFCGLYLLTKYLHSRQAGTYMAYFICICLVFIAHPLTGSFFLLCSFAMVAAESQKRTLDLLLLFAAFAVTLLLAFIWPYFSFKKAVVSSVTTDWYHLSRLYLYDPHNIYKIAPALIGLPILLIFLLKKRYKFLVAGFLLCSVEYVLSYVLNIRLGERYIFFTLFFLQVSAAWYFRQMEIMSSGGIREIIFRLDETNLHKFVFLLVLISCFSYQVLKLGFEQAGYTIMFRPMPYVSKYDNPIDKYIMLNKVLSAGDTVLSDPLTSWPLPAMLGVKIVCLYHTNPMVPDNKERTSDVMKFYDSSTSLKEKAEIIEKYKATHILLNYERMKDNRTNRINNYFHDFRFDDGLVNQCRQLGKIVYRTDKLVLFKTGRHRTLIQP